MLSTRKKSFAIITASFFLHLQLPDSRLPTPFTASHSFVVCSAWPEPKKKIAFQAVVYFERRTAPNTHRPFFYAP